MTYLSDHCGTDALAATSCSVVVTDATLPDNPIIFVNAAFTALSGYSVAEVVGHNCRFLQGPRTDPMVSAEIRAAIAAGQGIRREILNYRKDGTVFWNDLRIDPIRNPAGRLTGFVGIQYQADAVHRAAEEKAEAESKLAKFEDHIPGYIYQRVMQLDGSIEVVYCSPSICTLLGIEESELSRRFFDYVHPDDLDALTAAIRSSAAAMSISREEFRMVSSSGVVHWLRSDAPPRRMANGEISWNGFAIEISAEKRWESEIADRALLDPLTGLLTRVAWRKALTTRLNATSDRLQPCGVLCIDIKEFRDLNDRFGQHVGDDILRATAQRLTAIAMPVGGIAARLAGDEFAILVPVCAGEVVLSSLARSVSEVLAAQIPLGAQHISIRTRIGATLSKHCKPETLAGDDLANEMIMQAELALRWAKQDGGDGHVIYSRERDDRFQNRALLAASLEQAIANDELELHFQPLVDLASGRIVSAEALVRWNHPILGVQRPDLFIPLAEASGLIIPLGRWVFDQVIRQSGLWRNEELNPPPIAINVSGNQLRDPGFVAMVEDSLRTGNANASDFEVELTEGVLIEPSAQVISSLTALRTMGFTIAIDDFGSGHATFRYLRDFPVDKLKVDQTFVRKLILESTDALIIRAIISLAKDMGIGIVAEGVETEMQRDFLLREGCTVGQGYFFSMPLVAEDFGWLLANDVRLPLRADEQEPEHEVGARRQ